MQLDQAVVVAEPDVTQPGAISVASLVPHAAAQFRNVLIIRRDHSTFASGHLFVGVKREYTRISKRAGAPSLNFRANRFASVFYHQEAIFTVDFHQFFHRARQSKNMHGHQRLHHPASLSIDKRAFRGPPALAPQKFADRLRIQIESYWVDVHKSRESAFVQETIYGCHEAERSRNNLIIGANFQRSYTQMQRRRAAVHGDRIARTGIGRELFFKFLDPRSHAQLSGLQDLPNVIHFALADVRSRKWNVHALILAKCSCVQVSAWSDMPDRCR